MVMYLDLNKEEAEVLQRALDVRLFELRHELAKVESIDYRQALRKELDLLEGIGTRLKGPRQAAA